ncbi:MAG: HD domain-containing protein [Lachnospiraceae bacterium]|nr:HD domain-containing protein [Lachnospiraceae bacterium]
MAYKLIAAIDVGSYELEMKIFEISQKNKIVMINHVRKVIELGRDTYVTGRVDFKHIDEVCEILYGFTDIMKEYNVTEYVAYATSSIREAENESIILDRIKVKTGLRIKVLGNEEQRFLGFKALTVNDEFANYITEGTAIVDVGAGSIQVSLLDGGTLVTTQNIKLGSLRIRELLYKLSDDREHFNRLVEELINNDIQTFKKMYLKDRKINNIIAIGDYIMYFAFKNGKYIKTMTRESFLDRFHNFMGKNVDQISEKMGITEEQASLLLPCAMVYKRLIEETDTQKIWFPGVDLCDGIAAEYAIDKKIIKVSRDFDEDIMGVARMISKRYKANQNHIAILERNVLAIFDAMKKVHGLGNHERKLLQISAILHDCGKYISMNKPGESSYNIIMSTEIIGLSQRDKNIVANVVKYNTEDFFDEDNRFYDVSREDYMTIAKLVAILRVANAMDRSHKQKFKNSKVVMKDDTTLVITTYVRDDITLEKGLFTSKAEFFEEVYGVRPVLKQKRVTE